MTRHTLDMLDTVHEMELTVPNTPQGNITTAIATATATKPANSGERMSTVRVCIEYGGVGDK